MDTLGCGFNISKNKCLFWTFGLCTRQFARYNVHGNQKNGFFTCPQRHVSGTKHSETGDPHVLSASCRACRTLSPIIMVQWLCWKGSCYGYMFGIQALSVHGKSKKQIDVRMMWDELDLFAKMKDETHTFQKVLDIGQFALSKPLSLCYFLYPSWFISLFVSIFMLWPASFHFLYCGSSIYYEYSFQI